MKVCLLTPGQPSNNPRLVKEADCLATAGHQVRVICTDSGLWPSETDTDLLATRQWTCEYVGGSPRRQPWMHRWTRLRHSAARRLAAAVPAAEPVFGTAILSRAAPEIESAVERIGRQHLYIAHHATLLPVAARAAQRNRARLGYDAEDFYSGMWPLDRGPSPEDHLIERIERQWLRTCDYVTAAAPAIADKYAEKFGIERPVPVLNTFPLSQRPPSFRPTDTKGSLRLYWFSQCIGAGRGLEDAIRAMAALKGLNIELHLRGNWQTGYRAQLLGLAGELGVADRLYAHAPAPPDEMVRLAADYDIGLAMEVPRTQNLQLCLSNKVFTYLLSGAAAIGTATPAQRIFFTGIGRAACVYESGDIDALANCLRRWYLDRAALDAARRCAWEWGERCYNWDVEKQNFLRTVESGCGITASGMALV